MLTHLTKWILKKTELSSSTYPIFQISWKGKSIEILCPGFIEYFLASCLVSKGQYSIHGKFQVQTKECTFFKLKLFYQYQFSYQKKKKRLSHTNNFPFFQNSIFQITSINLNLLKFSGYLHSMIYFVPGQN